MMMGKTAYITARIEPALKASAEGVLQELGVSTTDAITMFMRQITLQHGLPFDVRIPNTATRRAIAELQAGRGKRFATVEELMKSSLKKRKRRKA
jgi:DNA-damage-inducible protein J